MRLPCRELKNYWRYRDASTKRPLLEIGHDCVTEGAEDRKSIDGRVQMYDVCGPLGSQDPTLPIVFSDVVSKIQDRTSVVSQRWKKEPLIEWFRKKDATNKMYLPSRRTSTIAGVTRIAGDKRYRCLRKRTDALIMLRQLRVELSRGFRMCSGEDFG